jgi:hypothetical protein
MNLLTDKPIGGYFHPCKPGHAVVMSGSTQSWEHYERMIARLMADQLATALCVTPNARLAGRISGRSRQIDVLIDDRHDTDNTRRIIVDAKKRSRKIDVTDVEAFRGLMEDVGATHGFLVCPAGYTKAAEKRAQMAVSLRLVPLNHIEDFDPDTWPRCGKPGCRHGRVFWDGYPEMSLILEPLNVRSTAGRKKLAFVHYVGKCDRCGRFHVQCLTCDDILSVPEDDNEDIGHQCRCKLPWFWLASVETDEHGAKSAELHVVRGIDKVETVDRRGL